MNKYCIIIYGNINNFSFELLLKKYRTFLPSYLLTKILQINNINNKMLSMLGIHLFMEGSIFLGKKKSILSKITLSKYGKPYLYDNSLYFNISHSEDTVACIISETNIVGIDIEYQRTINYNSLNIYTTKEEKRMQLAINPIHCFYRIWTLKEAITKCLGYGLYMNFKDVETTNNPIFINKKKLYTNSFMLNDNIRCSYATTNCNQKLVIINY